MNLFSTQPRLFKTIRLTNTTWRCTSNIDKEAVYYQLVFETSDQVKGYVQYKNQEEQTHVFSATFRVNENSIYFKNGEDRFKALYCKKVLHAVIDGEIYDFKRLSNKKYFLF